MPARSGNGPEDLRAAVQRAAAEDADDLIAAARDDARERVRAALSEIFAESMLEAVRERLLGSAPARPHPPAGGQDAWYVYGVVRSRPDADEALGGVTDVLEAGDVAALTARVPLEEYGEDRLRENLGDMAWVEARARDHEAVLDAARARTTVIPMRMCTVYRNEGGVREMLEREGEALARALDQMEGKSEWGVKVFADPRSLPAEPTRAGGSDDPPASAPGLDYMTRRRDERDNRAVALEALDGASAEIHERLSAVAAESLTVPPQRPEVSGHDGDMVLNGVYLVRDATAEHFHREVEELRSEFAHLGIELEPTGPWPPYNFVPDAIGAAW